MILGKILPFLNVRYVICSVLICTTIQNARPLVWNGDKVVCYLRVHSIGNFGNILIFISGFSLIFELIFAKETEQTSSLLNLIKAIIFETHTSVSFTTLRVNFSS